MKNINTKRIHNRRMVSGALYDFLAYLTTLNPSIAIGGSEDCTLALDKLVEWAQIRGLDILDADVINWNTKI
jgi:hypothetical protein